MTGSHIHLGVNSQLGEDFMELGQAGQSQPLFAVDFFP